MSGLRGIGAAGALACLILVTSVFGVSAAPYAALVMDARTGEVYHARNADTRLHPASLTKMMTLYLTFEAIRDGQLRLDQKVRVSSHAAGQVPSKIGLRRGQRVSIRDLIRATAVKSANDAAVALAEAIAGSERAFAKKMTARARQMGMTLTTFRNASGLTHPKQLSTARDMATLGRALFYDFPQYYNLFGRVSTTTMGKQVYNTNRRLLRNYRGADGIKTGYTRAAGFNLVSSAQRGEERIIAVVFGGRTGRWRNARVAELLDLGFKRAPARAPVIRTTQMAAMTSPLPVPRPTPGGATPPAAAEPSVVARVAESLGDAIVTPAAASEGAPTGPTFAPYSSPLPLRRPGTAVAALPVPRPTDEPQAKDEWALQLGVFAREETAIAELASAALRDIDGLSGARPVVGRTEVSGRNLFRARFTGLDRAEAQAACAELKSKGRDCLAIAPRN